MSDIASSRRMMAAFVFIVYGPICWALQLLMIYGGQSALCVFGTISQPAITIYVVVASIVAAALAAAGMIWPGGLYRLMAGEPPAPDQRGFLFWVMRALNALSLLAMLYAALGSVMLPACGALR
ncbi:hypothetical protein NO932_07765 [Pelagibacterium sp. 26DY04]|uniref:hypothetical protein n=1 Tax=Pelagibacterium sp. 26DY04 TaxID=2967130 RepID=UPI002814F246|nr:hypothetical protein [Pelagibacterium sp. 26DY04]WMT88498.1 hypothetical protein NO932_07765 [Pelagibacterium sp. 26DY04]